ncbi:MaoC family dehydratase [Brucella gallinifaecis]|uniref:MaoC family dehydratase n=1 Tax=Brucella gallinifaecis TaxID=215590 RepID=A0A502BPT1_9HYPH|nr:MaoC family dehydratase [Brucella gallinifaecis]TPF76542.1 MaoC family dehydratase [Brucella gallinifaecis]
MTDKAPKYAYEDFTPGLKLPFGPRNITKEEIIEFAREFDPQPFHLDEEAGKASVLGGLAASGWHTVSLYMRMIWDAYLKDSTSQGSPGIEFNRWKRPVLAGDTLSGVSTVIERRRSQSMSHIGILTIHNEIVNQRGEVVCELQHIIMMGLRNPEIEGEAA